MSETKKNAKKIDIKGFGSKIKAWIRKNGIQAGFALFGTAAIAGLAVAYKRGLIDRENVVEALKKEVEEYADVAVTTDRAIAACIFNDENLDNLENGLLKNVPTRIIEESVEYWVKLFGKEITEE